MDIRNIQYELRPRRMLEIFDFAVLVVMRRPGPFLTFTLPFVLVCVAANTALMSLFADPDDGLEWWHWLSWLLPWILFQQMQLLSLPLTLINGRLLFEEELRPGQIFREAVALLPQFAYHQLFWRGSLAALFAAPFVMIHVLHRYWHDADLGGYMALEVAIGLVALVAGWRALLSQIFRGEVLALERLERPLMRRRMRTLAAGNADRSLGFRLLELSLLFLAMSAVSLSWNFALEGLEFHGRHWWLDASFVPLSPPMQLLLFIFFAYHCTARFLYYIDSRSLREGWDLELGLIRGVRDTEEAVSRR